MKRYQITYLYISTKKHTNIESYKIRGSSKQVTIKITEIIEKASKEYEHCYVYIVSSIYPFPLSLCIKQNVNFKKKKKVTTRSINYYRNGKLGKRLFINKISTLIPRDLRNQIPRPNRNHKYILQSTRYFSLENLKRNIDNLYTYKRPPKSFIEDFYTILNLYDSVNHKIVKISKDEDELEII